MKGLTPTEKLVVLRLKLADRDHESLSRQDLSDELEISIDTLKKLLPSMRRRRLIHEERRGKLTAL